MKKYLGVVLMAGLLFSFSFALADDNGGKGEDDQSSRREGFRERIRKDQESFRAGFMNEGKNFGSEVRMRKEEFRKFGDDKRREFWMNAKGMISQRFEVAVTNLERIQVRVQTLIDKSAAEGKDTEAAKDYLSDSKDKLAQAKVKVAQIKALLPTDGTKVTPEIFEQIKLGAREAKNLLKESHHDLLQAVRELKDLKDEDQDEDN
jgi:hypothetical protein